MQTCVEPGPATPPPPHAGGQEMAAVNSLALRCPMKSAQPLYTLRQPPLATEWNRTVIRARKPDGSPSHRSL
ncbi:Hypothetical protein SMAX5B_016935 [Scophthalmus maximus]|uniref:Uncharacterized protein n=1 Tax=Scophthalmus maximus TaxID=52904 RepID=A0A2U9CQD1_SCOMX|nr:Hypothetical protein SMAX5B_016935 [Scophthalmus maximus]